VEGSATSRAMSFSAISRCDDSSRMTKIRVQLASFVDRDVLVGELWVGPEQFAEVNTENGVPEMVIYPRRDGKEWIVPLEEVEAALRWVRQRLID
jgi:hypothetical protein